MPKIVKGARGGAGRANGRGGTGGARGRGSGSGGDGGENVGRGRAWGGQPDPPGVTTRRTASADRRLVSDLSMGEFLQVVRGVVREEQARDHPAVVAGVTAPAASVSLASGSTSAASSQAAASVTYVSSPPVTSTHVSGSSSVPLPMIVPGMSCSCMTYDLCLLVWVLCQGARSCLCPFVLSSRTTCLCGAFLCVCGTVEGHPICA